MDERNGWMKWMDEWNEWMNEMNGLMKWMDNWIFRFILCIWNNINKLNLIMKSAEELNSRKTEWIDEKRMSRCNEWKN
jgi:hypothetical protein